MADQIEVICIDNDGLKTVCDALLRSSVNVCSNEGQFTCMSSDGGTEFVFRVGTASNPYNVAVTCADDKRLKSVHDALVRSGVKCQRGSDGEFACTSSDGGIKFAFRVETSSNLYK